MWVTVTIALCLLPDKETCEQWQQQGTPGYPYAEHSASHTSLREETQQQEEEARLDCTRQPPPPPLLLSLHYKLLWLPSWRHRGVITAGYMPFSWNLWVVTAIRPLPPSYPSPLLQQELHWCGAVPYADAHCRGEQHSSRARCFTGAHSCCCILIPSFYKSQNFVQE